MKKDFSAKVISLKDSVSYERDSIVSQAMINRKAGTVTLFAFDRGQGLSEHTAPFDSLISIMDGEALISIEKKFFRVSRSQSIILPAGKLHSVKAAKRFKMMLVMIKGGDDR